ncbi:hypothetical protein Clacol_004881 [Clathrus columnatus]|uniref:Uncharacterized protein n=1 Tax=Clathrus columnatus TaxID=1419009 RepID=A0AAV5ABR2_9AGAM|nr:hypothetical protein Clacol_004881 [Clathrus columnatus]
MHTQTSLSPADRASFAVSSRLLSCVVTESLLRAIFVPVNPNSAAAESGTCGACVILSNKASQSNVPLGRPYHPTDIFLLVSLRYPPILKPSVPALTMETEVGLVDPSDMLPWIYEIKEEPSSHHSKLSLKPDYLNDFVSSLPTQFCNVTQHTIVFSSLDPLYIWEKISADLGLDDESRMNIAEELRSSMDWQIINAGLPSEIAYEERRTRPTLTSSQLEWERALVEGHSTHPMHRARRTISPLPIIIPGQYDYYKPRVRFAWVPREQLLLQGEFEELLQSLRNSAEQNAGDVLEDLPDHVLFPIHELQIPNIATKFSDAVILPEKYYVVASAQASIRTLTLPSSGNLTLKTAVGVKISSALRTISHFTAYFSPKFGRDIVPKLAINSNVLIIENEVASAVYNHNDPDIAKHCTAMLRITYDGSEKGDKVIPAAVLIESAYQDENDGIPAAVTALSLDSDSKRYAFLERYINLVFDAFIPPLLINCVAFEAHGQNTLARFDQETGELKGFVYRDFGGLRIHAPTLYESTGILIDTLPNHCVLVDNVEEAYRKSYHTLIHCHVQRLIRVLGFHHDGRGWCLVRDALSARIPPETRLWDSWLNPERQTVMGKSLLRMKMAGVYRDAVYEEIPNLIHYRP